MPISRETLRLIRALRDEVGTEADDAVRNLTKAWVEAWDGLAADLEAGLVDLAVKQQTLGRWPRAWELARIDRLRRALNLAEQILTRLALETGSTVAAAASAAVTATVKAEPAILASQLPAAGRAAAIVAFDRQTPTAVEVMVQAMTRRIVSASRPLSAAATDAMHRELVRGVVVGDSPQQTARRMVERVHGAFDGGLTRAMALSRTETLDAYRTASLASHQANRNVLAGWRWLCALSRTSCISCWSRNGSLHDVDEPGPNDHVAGRCCRVPVVKPWSELGIAVVEPDDQFPDARATFARLPEADRIAVMGAERHELWSSGRLDWDDLAIRRTNPGWRDSWTPTPLKDLRALARDS
jgi:hypothetical protein